MVAGQKVYVGKVYVVFSEILRRGRSQGGLCAICRKLRAKFAQNYVYFVLCIRGRVRKTVANLSQIRKAISDNFANTSSGFKEALLQTEK